MANLRQFQNLMPGLALRATTAALALAIAFVLTVVTTEGAHAQSFQVIYTFTGNVDGAQPFAGLSIDGNENLYGTTHSGNEGTNWGNVFQLKRAGTGWVFIKLQLFDGALANRPLFGPDHILYGTSPNELTNYPSGYIYSVKPPLSAFCRSVTCPWNARIIYGFSGGADGGTPRYGDLIFDQAGNIYGTASLGGVGNGVVFEMVHSGSNWTEQPLYAFAGGMDGATPFGGVIFDNAGNLYGTTTRGGSSGNGTVFELSPSGSGWTERVLYNFQGADDGNNLVAGLIFDQAGNLYGTTANGGSGGGGTVFKLTPAGGGNWNFNLLHSFSGGANCGPWGSVTLDGAGNLYGTTLCDGANNAGSVFRVTTSGSGFTSLHDFTAGNDGRRPFGNVTIDRAGNLFGTTSLGGTHGEGVIWEIAP